MTFDVALVVVLLEETAVVTFDVALVVVLLEETAVVRQLFVLVRLG